MSYISQFSFKQDPDFLVRLEILSQRPFAEGGIAVGEVVAVVKHASRLESGLDLILAEDTNGYITL